MMKTLIGFCLLFSTTISTAHAEETPSVKWMDIEVSNILKLKTDLKINDAFTLKQGSTFAVNDINPIEEIRVEQINLVLFPCSSPLDETKVDMTILNDTYGFEMAKSCRISLYLEYKDFNRDSWFEVVQP